MNAKRGHTVDGAASVGRLDDGAPFTHVGVDFTGSIQVKMSPKATTKQPAYIALFTCLKSRAIHLELVLSNHTEEFIMAFKRMAGKGMPTHVYSDNAQTFKRGEKELREQVSRANKDLHAFAEKYRFQWHFSTQLASHTGGVWER